MKLENKIKIWDRLERISNHARDLNREREEAINLFSQDIKEQEALRKAIRNPVPETLEMINDILQQMNKETVGG